ncbi:leucine-rich repeat extensin-like protein 2 [Quillaja saponaria]|uniref:Leucine-rich repeat extensin-like protein 2 n=1 Tax=Quillaja saponaria TaxID=32244 RepID=A0AAD7LJA9_QUISA|nr:leucine-rich repeat extensin-like protein 2 [Quillaja saponaria]
MPHQFRSKNLEFMRRKWFSWFLRLGLMGLAMFAGVTFEDEVGGPATNLLCISDCATCPVICSPPPPPLLVSYPPPSPSEHHASSPSYYTYPPPSQKSRPPPPPPPPPPPSPPPPTPSSYSSKPAPPPPYKNNNSPPSGSSQPTSGPHDYSYPYYYFYASEASFLSIHTSVFLLPITFLWVFC